MKSNAAILLGVAMLCALATGAEARSRGKCDGFQRCRCGVTQARHFGLPLNYNGHNLKRAIEWVRAFPRTRLAVGVVVYQRRGGPSGHVSRVVNYSGHGCIATVSDDAGTYERDVCKRGAIYLDVSRNFSSRQEPKALN